jgi:hypothetical protein
LFSTPVSNWIEVFKWSPAWILTPWITKEEYDKTEKQNYITEPFKDYRKKETVNKEKELQKELKELKEQVERLSNMPISDQEHLKRCLSVLKWLWNTSLDLLLQYFEYYRHKIIETSIINTQTEKDLFFRNGQLSVIKNVIEIIKWQKTQEKMDFINNKTINV